MSTQQKIADAKQRISSLGEDERQLLDQLAGTASSIEAALTKWLPGWFDTCSRGEVQRNHGSARTADVEALSRFKENIATLKSEVAAIVRDSLATVDWPHESELTGYEPSWVSSGKRANNETRTASNQLPGTIARAVLDMCSYLGPPLAEAGIVTPVRDEPGHGGAPWRIQANGDLRFYDDGHFPGHVTAEIPETVQNLATGYGASLKGLGEVRRERQKAERGLQQAEALLRFEEA